MKGKNYSLNNVNGKRKESDFYPTHYSLTRLLLDKVRLRGAILEPACGDGAIVKVLSDYGYVCDYYDIERDFLKETTHYGTIITNPPFSLAKEFIIKAKECSDEFFYLLPLNYCHGKQRYDLFYANGVNILNHIYVFTRYPMFDGTLRDDGKHKTGMCVFCWMHFISNGVTETKLSWLDNQKFVLSKKD